MNEELNESLINTLKLHYGATKVVVDNSNVIVYGVECELARKAVESILIEYVIIPEKTFVGELHSESKCLFSILKKDLTDDTEKSKVGKSKEK